MTSAIEEIQAAVDRGTAKLAEAQEAEAQARSVAALAEQTKRDEEWSETMAGICGLLPEWAHPFLFCDNTRGPEAWDGRTTSHVVYPATLALPGCAPIYVYWCLHTSAGAMAAAVIATPEVVEVWDDEEERASGFEAAWTGPEGRGRGYLQVVGPQWGLDLDIAIAQAARQALRMPEVQAEAERATADLERRRATPAVPRAIPHVPPAHRIAAALERIADNVGHMVPS